MEIDNIVKMSGNMEVVQKMKESVPCENGGVSVEVVGEKCWWNNAWISMVNSQSSVVSISGC